MYWAAAAEAFGTDDGADVSRLERATSMALLQAAAAALRSARMHDKVDRAAWR
jgi:hypothetical protein